MEKIIERKRRRLEMRPVYARSEPELEEPPRMIVDWTTKEDTLFQNAIKVPALKFDLKESQSTQPFSGNPLRVLRMNAPSAWSDVFKN